MTSNFPVVIFGAGKIGRMIAHELTRCGDYRVMVADQDQQILQQVSGLPGVETVEVDVTSADQLRACLRGQAAVISALPYFLNPMVAEAALDTGADYFDLTEDIATTEAVRDLARRAGPHQVFVPQCGLAPGFVSIVAHHLTRDFEELDSVQMRVGALPQFPTGKLNYNLTWSTDGLINEYCNPCDAIHKGRRREVLPLEGLEQFSLDGVRYEAFNTSGGLGSLCETLDQRVRELNYKTIRYPGHRDLVTFLLNELRLSEKRGLLKAILEDSVPVTDQDVVIIFCTVTGRRRGRLVKVSDARKIYAAEVDSTPWSAIQLTTSAGVCAMVDLQRTKHLAERGWVRQESVSLDLFLANRFGRRFSGAATTRFSSGEHRHGQQSDAWPVGWESADCETFVPRTGP